MMSCKIQTKVSEQERIISMCKVNLLVFIVTLVVLAGGSVYGEDWKENGLLDYAEGFTCRCQTAKIFQNAGVGL